MTDFGSPLLARMLEPEDLAFVQSLAVRRTYRDGEMVHDRGDDNPGMGLIVRGRVKLVTPRSNGRENFNSFVHPGQHYGDACLLDRSRRIHRAIAIGETEVDHISQEDFPRLLERPAIVRALYEIAAYRLLVLIDVVDDMRALPPEVRLAKLLFMMHRQDGRTRIDFLQEDLANLLGVSTVTLSKSLRTLRDAGLIDTGYRQVLIPDPSRMEAWLAVNDPD